MNLRSWGVALRNLILIGVPVTWACTAVLGHYLAGLSWPIAILLGAILVVTGPTVIIPLLRHIRPSGRTASLLKWEGIVIDPVGAMLAVLVFEVLVAGGFEHAASVTLHTLLKTLVVSVGLSALGALLLIGLLWRRDIPAFLESSVTLMVVLGTYTISHVVQHESGLFTVTLLGILMANQKWVAMHSIVEFKENLRVILISSLFIMLAARLEPEQMKLLGWGGLFFFLAMLAVRPLSVWLSAAGTGLSWREKTFLSWMAPRGIVAAAVTSVFALRLEALHMPGAEKMVPLTFVIIIGTVALYGLTAGPLARALGLSARGKGGAFIIGAHTWARELGEELKKTGCKILLADSNWGNVNQARLMGLPVAYVNVLSENAEDRLELEGLGFSLALTSNNEVNAMASLRLIEHFGKDEVYQLSTPQDHDNKDGTSMPLHLKGQKLFDDGLSFPKISTLWGQGYRFHTTNITETFGYDEYQKKYEEKAYPLFHVSSDKDLRILTSARRPRPEPGVKLISLVPPDQKEDPA